MKKVLFVCTGNICRSPMAQSLFQNLVDTNQVRSNFRVDSCGTTAAHIGQSTDRRIVEILNDRGVKLAHKAARQVQKQSDFFISDYIFALDKGHQAFLIRLSPAEHHHKIHCLLQNENGEDQDIPDPFHGTIRNFNQSYEVILQACKKWFHKIK